MADLAVPDGTITRRFREHADALGLYHAEVVDVFAEADASTPQSDLKFFRINSTADGDNVELFAVVGKILRVLGYCFTADVAGLVTIKDSAAGVKAEFDITAGAVGLPIAYAGNDDAPAFETAVGEGLLINVQAGQDVTGHGVYREIG